MGLTVALAVAFELAIASAVGAVLVVFLSMHCMPSASRWTPTLGSTPKTTSVVLPPPTGAPTRRAVWKPTRSRAPIIAVANRLAEVMVPFVSPSAVFGLRLRRMPMIDVAGAGAFTGFRDRAHNLGSQVAPSGLQPWPRAALARVQALGHPVTAADVAGFDDAAPVVRSLANAGRDIRRAATSWNSATTDDGQAGTCRSRRSRCEWSRTTRDCASGWGRSGNRGRTRLPEPSSLEDALRGCT